jgi:hypothetical protein
VVNLNNINNLKFLEVSRAVNPVETNKVVVKNKIKY